MEDKEAQDPYKGIKGPDTQLTLWQEIREKLRKYIEGEKKFWREMKEPFIKLGKIFGTLIAIAGIIALAINQIEYGANSNEDEKAIVSVDESEKKERFIPTVTKSSEKERFNENDNIRIINDELGR